MQIVASLPDAQDQGPIDLVNGVEQSMYQYMNNIRNGTQMHSPNSNTSQPIG
jgi:hypothetical protein